MSWIKMRTLLQTDGRVRVLSERLKCNVGSVTGVDAVLGKLFRLWCLGDAHADENGVLFGWSKTAVDDHLGCAGFCEALPSDWIDLSGDWVKLPEYQEHNGATAKSRALTQKRVSKFRRGNASNSVSVTEALPDSNPPTVAVSSLISSSLISSSDADPEESEKPKEEPAVIQPEQQQLIPEKKPKKPKPPEEPAEELAPVWPGCERFRMTEHQAQLVHAKYAERKYPAELFPYVIDAVDVWLCGDTPGGKAARNSPTHFRQLYAGHFIEKGGQAYRQAKTAGGSGPKAANGFKFKSVQEQNREFMQERLDRARKEEPIDVTPEKPSWEQ